MMIAVSPLNFIANPHPASVQILSSTNLFSSISSSLSSVQHLCIHPLKTKTRVKVSNWLLREEVTFIQSFTRCSFWALGFSCREVFLKTWWSLNPVFRDFNGETLYAAWIWDSRRPQNNLHIKYLRGRNKRWKKKILKLGLKGTHERAWMPL